MEAHDEKERSVECRNCGSIFTAKAQFQHSGFKERIIFFPLCDECRQENPDLEDAIYTEIVVDLYTKDAALYGEVGS